MPERGKSIYLEGIGGAGKSTQVEFLLKHISSLGQRVILTREPGGNPAAEKIRGLIFSLKEKGVINADHQMALFFAARYLWVTEVVRPNLDKGINVVSDRSYFSTAAYQGYAEGGDLETIRKISDIVMDGCKPNAVILLDISPEEAALRRNERLENDPFDKTGLEYVKRLVNGYRDMAQNNWGDVPWIIINGEQQVEKVSDDIQRALNLSGLLEGQKRSTER